MVEVNADHASQASNQWIAFGRLIVGHKRLLIAAPLFAALLVAGVLQFVSNQYTAVLKIAPSTSVQLYMWALRENGLTRTIASRFGLQEHYGENTLLATRQKLESNVQFVSNLQDNFVDVRVTDKDPELAKKIANAYGDGMVDLLIDLHLTDASKAIYSLQSRRERAEKSLAEAKAKLGESSVAAALPYISISTRLGLVGMAGIQAETTLSSSLLVSNKQDQNDLARQTLDQNELTRLQERLASIQRALADDVQVKKSGIAIGSLVSALDVLQDEAYWEAMVSRIDRRIDVLRVIARDEIRLIRATTPEDPSGPRRLMLSMSAGFAALLLSLVYVLGVAWVRHLRQTGSI